MKTHEWHQGPAAFEKMKHGFTHVILSVRENFLKEEMWVSAATHVIHFEELVAYDASDPEDESKIGALKVLKGLSKHSGLNLSWQELKEVDYVARSL